MKFSVKYLLIVFVLLCLCRCGVSGEREDESGLKCDVAESSVGLIDELGTRPLPMSYSYSAILYYILCLTDALATQKYAQ